MCGIFGIFSDQKIIENDLEELALHARQRGRDSSGLMYLVNKIFAVERADFDIVKLLKTAKLGDSSVVFGHSRLITNGLADNQPVVPPVSQKMSAAVYLAF